MSVGPLRSEWIPASEWKTGLFDCFDDTNICISGLFCPCYLFGQNVEQTGGITYRCPCFLYAWNSMLLNCGYIHKRQRSNIRDIYGLPGGCGDCLTTCFCSPCAVCQEARELKIRGQIPNRVVQQQPRQTVPPSMVTQP
ncbi:unnamed protein product [Didymodactylos carnosus]|uniref:PLAC8 family protein n=1 Tax=Didymodactylos carnosus TaxID=1234261 RepID=A0A8S2E7C7_9BILA|nr:unnamed protein product [Didymodactylos carnosus]CAF3960659.1 unnamed protein product [Didymodactylos carnosus]